MVARRIQTPRSPQPQEHSQCLAPPRRPAALHLLHTGALRPLPGQASSTGLGRRIGVIVRLQKLQRVLVLYETAVTFLLSSFLFPRMLSVTACDAAAQWNPLFTVNALFFLNVCVGFWLVGLCQRSFWLIDPYWSIIPVLIAHFYRLHATHAQSAAEVPAARGDLMLLLLWVWGARLTHSYFRREEWKFGEREDWRYNKMATVDYPKTWPILSFFMVGGDANFFPCLQVRNLTLPAGWRYAMADVGWNLRLAAALRLLGVGRPYFTPEHGGYPCHCFGPHWHHNRLFLRHSAVPLHVCQRTVGQGEEAQGTAPGHRAMAIFAASQLVGRPC